MIKFFEAIGEFADEYWPFLLLIILSLIPISIFSALYILDNRMEYTYTIRTENHIFYCNNVYVDTGIIEASNCLRGEKHSIYGEAVISQQVKE